MNNKDFLGTVVTVLVIYSIGKLNGERRVKREFEAFKEGMKAKVRKSNE